MSEQTDFEPGSLHEDHGNPTESSLAAAFDAGYAFEQREDRDPRARSPYRCPQLDQAWERGREAAAESRHWARWG